MCDPTSGLSILMHGVISLPDATSYDTSNKIAACTCQLKLSDQTTKLNDFNVSITITRVGIKLFCSSFVNYLQ